jgi:5-methylthioadenosine/S-adenosylhomocysteine deaminase
MDTAALLAKLASSDPTAAPAAAVLEMATLGGARALGMEDRLGSLEPGKRADLIVVSLDAPRLHPLYEPVSHLVYATGREAVTEVWVAGERILADRTLTTVDEGAIIARARLWQERLR